MGQVSGQLSGKYVMYLSNVSAHVASVTEGLGNHLLWPPCLLICALAFPPNYFDPMATAHTFAYSCLF